MLLLRIPSLVVGGQCDQNCGSKANGKQCDAGGACCSTRGYCGTSDEYFGQENCESHVKFIVTAQPGSCPEQGRVKGAEETTSAAANMVVVVPARSTAQVHQANNDTRPGDRTPQQ